MTTEWIFISAVIIVIGGHYWFGNFSVWGKLSGKYKTPSINKTSKDIKNFVNIGIRVNGKWKGGVRAQCYSNESGILLETNKYLKIFIPSVFLPWIDVNEIQNTNNGFMGASRTEIKLKENGVSILVPQCCEIQSPGI